VEIQDPLKVNTYFFSTNIMKQKREKFELFSFKIL
jgi:hypothetical protein